MDKKIILTLLGAVLIGLLGAACSVNDAGPAADEVRIVYRSPT